MLHVLKIKCTKKYIKYMNISVNISNSLFSYILLLQNISILVIRKGDVNLI